jgi:peptidoglycan/xylan/chitin deacetylase (PgdA/CDA1 family)
MSIPKPSAGNAAEFMLSFDDGPLPGATDLVLHGLAALKASDGAPVRAGFFLVGDAPREFWNRRRYYAPYELWSIKGSMVRYPQLTRRIADAGHVIGNHTFSHPWPRWPWMGSMNALRGEISQWEMVLRDVTCLPCSRLFRPPYLTHSNRVFEAARDLGYRIITGQPVSDTWPGASAAHVERFIQRKLEGWDKEYPCVLVFHDIRRVTHEHIADIVGHLQRAGFRLVHFDPRRLPSAEACAWSM